MVAKDWDAAMDRADADKAADIKAERDLLKAELAKLRRKVRVSGAQTNLILEAVREVLTENPVNIRIPSPPKTPKHKDVEHAVVHLTDTQIGKVTKTYDSAIAGARIRELGKKVATCIERHRSYARVDVLHLYLGGDLVEGETIFDGQAHVIDSAVLEQATRTAPSYIAELIVGFLGVVDHVNVVGVPGNHGRSAHKGSNAHPLTNWDSVAMSTARLMIGEQKRVSWNLPDDWHAGNDVLGHKHLLIHGDNLYTSVFGGKAFKARLLMWRESIPYDWRTMFFGHYHELCSGMIAGLRWQCGGSPESNNDFALRVLSDQARPMQRLQFWNEEHGLVADRPIYLNYGLTAALDREFKHSATPGIREANAQANKRLAELRKRRKR